jgi:hypothetical protein
MWQLFIYLFQHVQYLQWNTSISDRKLTASIIAEKFATQLCIFLKIISFFDCMSMSLKRFVIFPYGHDGVMSGKIVVFLSLDVRNTVPWLGLALWFINYRTKSLPEHFVLFLSHFVSWSWLLSRYKTTSGCEATAQCQDFYHQHWAMLLRRSET